MSFLVGSSSNPKWKIFNHKYKISRVEYKGVNDADFKEAAYPKDVLDSFYFKLDFSSGITVCAVNEQDERGCIKFDCTDDNCSNVDFGATYTLDKNL